MRRRPETNFTAQSAKATTPRYQVRKATHGGWYVYDTQTGRMWPGLVQAGARQLAAHLNRKPGPA